MSNSENGWPLVAEGGLEALPWLPNNARLLASPVASVLGYVAKQFEARVEHITSTSTYRPNAIISGTSAYSNHASGTALDLNGGKHPMGASGTFTSAQVAAIRAILAECSGVLRWGGDYTSRKDEMHFEIKPAPAPLRSPQRPPSSTPAPPATPTRRMTCPLPRRSPRPSGPTRRRPAPTVTMGHELADIKTKLTRWETDGGIQTTVVRDGQTVPWAKEVVDTKTKVIRIESKIDAITTAVGAQ